MRVGALGESVIVRGGEEQALAGAFMGLTHDFHWCIDCALDHCRKENPKD
jgi:hypothetical protein